MVSSSHWLCWQTVSGLLLNLVSDLLLDVLLPNPVLNLYLQFGAQPQRMALAVARWTPYATKLGLDQSGSGQQSSPNDALTSKLLSLVLLVQLWSQLC